MTKYVTSPVFENDLKDVRTAPSFREEMVRTAGTLIRGMDGIMDLHEGVLVVFTLVEVKPGVFVMFGYDAGEETLMAMKIIHRNDIMPAPNEGTA